MSGLAALFRRDGGVPSEAVVRRMLDRQIQGGPDGTDVLRLGPALLGHQHFWTTPEEVGERQPLVDGDGHVALAFDGRLDNRSELLRDLDGMGPESSDAALVLAAWERWGEAFLHHILGPYALILWDPWSRSLLCARDPMGQRTLCYHLDDERVVVASEEVGVLSAPGVDAAIDESSVARFFALREPAVGRTLYRDVLELPPGHLLRVGPGRSELRAFWEPVLEEQSSSRSDAEWLEELDAVLREAVACRMRGIERPAVLLSGGLDSAAVATVAAEERRRNRLAAPTAITWTFEDPALAACDETRWAGRVVEAGALPWIRVPVDDAWPRPSAERWPADPSRPFADAFGWAVDRAYRAGVDAGHRTVLTGYWGDQLWSRGGRWWQSLLQSGRYLELGRRLPLAAVRVVRRSLSQWVPGAKISRAAVTAEGPFGGFLTPEARSLCREQRPTVTLEPAVEGMLQPFHVWMATSRVRRAAGMGVDLREPFRDRRVYEWVHRRAPVHLLHRRPGDRQACRRVLAGRLPEAVRLRPDKAPLEPFFRRGFERDAAGFRDTLHSNCASWSRFVESGWLARLESLALSRSQERLSVIWLVTCYERWRSGGSEAAEFTSLGGRLR